VLVCWFVVGLKLRFWLAYLYMLCSCHVVDMLVDLSCYFVFGLLVGLIYRFDCWFGLFTVLVAGSLIDLFDWLDWLVWLDCLSGFICLI